MRVLVLGAAGMLGHRLCHSLSGRDGIEVIASLRGDVGVWQGHPAFARTRLTGHLSGENPSDIAVAIRAIAPDVVLNCIGIIKQTKAAKDPVPSLQINALLPHLLARYCAETGARLIHFSTDCVFSGQKGHPYLEEDIPDPPDLYGHSKLLGEVGGAGCLTLRTSIIGRELKQGLSLIDWFLTQQGTVRGYSHALYSGLTTNAMADLVWQIITAHPDLSGIYHVSAAGIDKLQLLEWVRQVYNHPVTLMADDSVRIDRRLDSSRFQNVTGWHPPDWYHMISRMHADDMSF